MFLKDLTKALNLPKYCENLKPDEKAKFSSYIANENDFCTFLDDPTRTNKSIVENLILLANGKVSNSFLSILSA